MVKRNLMSCLCKSGARVVHKYSKIETSIRMRPLNSLALNEPKRFWSNNHGLCNPRSWAHKHRCCLPLHNFNPCIASVKPNCCKCTVKSSPCLWTYTPGWWTRRAGRSSKQWGYGHRVYFHNKPSLNLGGSLERIHVETAGLRIKPLDGLLLSALSPQS